MTKKKAFGVITAVWNVFFVLVIVASIIGNVIAVNYDTVLSMYLPTIGGGKTQASTDTGSSVDTEYYKSDLTKAEVTARRVEFAKEVVGEGAIILKNDGALPLSSESEKKISLFGISAYNWLSSAGGSGGSVKSKISLKEAFESEGFSVNDKLWNFYESNSGKYGLVGRQTPYVISIGEIPQSEYTAEVKESYAEFSSAAVVVVSRQTYEGIDAPTRMDKKDFGGKASEHYLELCEEEKDLLKAVKNAGFSKIIVIVDSANPLEYGFINDSQYGVNACLWTGATGEHGVAAIGSIIAGKINPSGHIVDTYAYDVFSSPASQNVGDSRYVNADGTLLGKDFTYVDYAENIYIGYRYYETRYEDVVLGRANAGNYDYASTVQFPFGYGKGYTEFTWSDFALTDNENSVTISVKVTNSGSVAGKDVVQVYAQSPYTLYDETNGIEKSAVELEAFKKTKLLAAGESEVVTVSFDKNNLCSYDKSNPRYVAEAGRYYVTAAKNAHEAVNNVLLRKKKEGTTLDESKMSGTGSADFSAAIDLTKEIVRTKLTENGATVTNLFNGSENEGTVYLSRSNWKAMDNNGLARFTGTIDTRNDGTAPEAIMKTLVASKELEAKLKNYGWDASGAPASEKNSVAPVLAEENGLELISMRNKSFDDYDWEKLIRQMKFSDLKNLFTKGGYGSVNLDSVNKPKCVDQDGPSGIHSYVTDFGAYTYFTVIVLAATWNTDLASEYGQLVGHDCLYVGVNGWYAPGLNLHRTPFSGRGAEYYSEDPLLSYSMAREEIKGVQKYGVYVYAKHFALNDMETNRNEVSVWATEQSIRELYLKAFEGVLIGGNESGRDNALGVMMGKNRIGATMVRGHYNLITGYLRNELDWKGIVVTDMTNDGKDINAQELASGLNLILTTATCSIENEKEAYVRNKLQDSAKYILYVVANSNAMNGFTIGTKYTAGFPVYVLLLIVYDVLVVAGIAVGDLFIVKKYLKAKKEESENENA